MLKLILIYGVLTLVVFLFSLFADITDRYLGISTWYKRKKLESRILRVLARFSPLQPWRWIIRKILLYPRTAIFFGIFIFIQVWIHFSNPYAAFSFVQQPYSTSVSYNEISYHQNYQPIVLADPVSDMFGYYKSGYLVLENTLFGGAPIKQASADQIIDTIHKRRFDPSKPYLISGDQFSVLYPRNLGVFYNQILDPNTAHSHTDWENRQRIYLQSALYAIDGLSVGDTPKTTLIPIAPHTMVTTRVHPGEIGSDAVYGTLYALNAMHTPATSSDRQYTVQTMSAVDQILSSKHDQLKHMVDAYRAAVQNPTTGLVRTDVSLSGARDGVQRKSSFYDNVILWKTLSLANDLGIEHISQNDLDALHDKIDKTFWDEEKGYYENDQFDGTFSSDWLIGYVTGYFNLDNPQDLARTKRIIAYIRANHIAEPLPIRYQVGKPKDMPFMVKTFVPSYGSNAIWSYWGAQYMTLLTDLSQKTGDRTYRDEAVQDVDAYSKAIVRDGGFAETFNDNGEFLQSGVYKSIRITGWVVQYEHAVQKIQQATSSSR